MLGRGQRKTGLRIGEGGLRGGAGRGAEVIGVLTGSGWEVRREKILGT